LAFPVWAQSDLEDLQRNDQRLLQAMAAAKQGVTPKEFTTGCVTSPFSTTPTGPQWTANIETSSTESVKLTAWRVPCSGNDGQLLLTFTPVIGAPFVCGVNVVQNGTQLSDSFLNISSSGLDSLCTALLVPATAYIDPFPASQTFDDDGAMTIFYRNRTGAFQQINVPAFDPAAYQATPPADKVLQGGLSGTYWLPTRSGEGVVVDFGLAGGQPVLFFTWYTYGVRNQQWLTGANTFTTSQTTITMDVINTTGANFGAAFFPQDVVRNLWGTVTMRFPDCSTMELTYDPIVGDSGTLVLTRLFDRMGLAGCN